MRSGALGARCHSGGTCILEGISADTATSSPDSRGSTWASSHLWEGWSQPGRTHSRNGPCSVQKRPPQLGGPSPACRRRRRPKPGSSPFRSLFPVIRARSACVCSHRVGCFVDAPLPEWATTHRQRPDHMRKRRLWPTTCSYLQPQPTRTLITPHLNWKEGQS